MNKFIINSIQNRIELYFDNKPNEKILMCLKDNGWRWNPTEKHWYARKSSETLYFAQKVCPYNATPKTIPTVKKIVTPTINSVSFNQTDTSGNVISIVLSKINGRYNITSSKNMIQCVDCGKFISIHSVFCVSCGCSLLHTTQTLFNEQAKIKINEFELEQMEEKKKQDRMNATIIQLKEKIKRLSNSYDEYSFIDTNPTLEELEERYEELEALREKEYAIEHLPAECKEIFRRKKIELSFLTPDAILKLRNKCSGFDDLSKEVRAEIKKRIPAVFRKSINSYVSNEDSVKKVWSAYWKYLSTTDNLSVYDSHDFENVIIQNENTTKKLSVKFLSNLKNYFSQKAQEYLIKSYNDENILIDSKACKKYLIYSELSNNVYTGNRINEIVAFELLDDYKFIDYDYLYRRVKITELDSIVGTSFVEHCSLDYKNFLVNIPPHKYVLGCPFLHPFEIVVGEISFTNRHNEEEKETILMAYCEECDKYYIYEQVFLNLILKGTIRAKTILSSGNKDCVNNLTSMSPESLLKKCGYTVNAIDDLSSIDRQKILMGVIENKLYTPAGIISHLQFQINLNLNVFTRDMRSAIAKWEEDILFLKQNY